jgi:hypothetical protein
VALIETESLLLLELINVSNTRDVSNFESGENSQA